MKKTIFIILLSCFAISPFLTMAASIIEPGTAPGASDLGITESPIEEPKELLGVIADIVGWVYTIFFIVAVLFILIAAFNYLTAADNPEKIKTSHKQILWAVIAIVIALMAVGARVIIENFLRYKQF